METKDALSRGGKEENLNPTTGDGKDEVETRNRDEDVEKEYSDDEERVRPYVPYNTSSEDCDEDEYKNYMRVIRESKGFKVPPVPEGIKIAGTGPVVSYDYEGMEELSRSALVWYKNNNKEDMENYEFARVCRGNAMPARGIIYYITFLARAVGANHEVTFQTKALYGLEHIFTFYSCEIVDDDS